VFSVVNPVGQWGRVNVHLVGDILDALLNLRGWNEDIRTPTGRTAWGKRCCTYFVYDPGSRLFAPSKFCAYTPVFATVGASEPIVRSCRMSAEVYVGLNDSAHIMDGQLAWRYLVSGLGMRQLLPAETTLVATAFASWLEQCGGAIGVRGGEPVFLTPPAW
jgi:hypothetical protein